MDKQLNTMLTSIGNNHIQNEITSMGIVHRNNPEILQQATVELITKFYDLSYDIIIDDGESSPTARIASTQSAKELLQYAQAMPPMAVMTIVKAIIDMSDFPGKEEILTQLGQAEQIAAMQQAGVGGEEGGQG